MNLNLPTYVSSIPASSACIEHSGSCVRFTSKRRRFEGRTEGKQFDTVLEEFQEEVMGPLKEKKAKLELEAQKKDVLSALEDICTAKDKLEALATASSENRASLEAEIRLAKSQLHAEEIQTPTEIGDAAEALLLTMKATLRNSLKSPLYANAIVQLISQMSGKPDSFWPVEGFNGDTLDRCVALGLVERNDEGEARLLHV